MNLELQSMAIDLPPLAAHPNRAPFRGVLTLVDVPSDRPPAGAKGHRVLLTRGAAERALPSLLGMALDYNPALDRHDARRKVGIVTEANVVDSRVAQGGTCPERMRGSPAMTGASHAAALAAEGLQSSHGPGPSGAEAHLRVAAAIAGLKACSTQLAATALAFRHPIAESREPTAARIEIAGYLYARDFPEVLRELRRQTGLYGTALGMSYEITDARIEDLRAAVWIVTDCTFTGAAILRRDKAAYRDTWIELT